MTMRPRAMPRTVVRESMAAILSRRGTRLKPRTGRASSGGIDLDDLVAHPHHAVSHDVGPQAAAIGERVAHAGTSHALEVRARRAVADAGEHRVADGEGLRRSGNRGRHPRSRGCGASRTRRSSRPAVGRRRSPRGDQRDLAARTSVAPSTRPTSSRSGRPRDRRRRSRAISSWASIGAPPSVRRVDRNQASGHGAIPSRGSSQLAQPFPESRVRVRATAPAS